MVRRVAGWCRSCKHVLAEVEVYQGHRNGRCRACARDSLRRRRGDV